MEQVSRCGSAYADAAVLSDDESPTGDSGRVDQKITEAAERGHGATCAVGLNTQTHVCRIDYMQPETWGGNADADVVAGGVNGHGIQPRGVIEDLKFAAIHRGHRPFGLIVQAEGETGVGIGVDAGANNTGAGDMELGGGSRDADADIAARRHAKQITNARPPETGDVGVGVPDPIVGKRGATAIAKFKARNGAGGEDFRAVNMQRLLGSGDADADKGIGSGAVDATYCAEH